MGFLKMFRNITNAEGARESIRLSYLKHYRLARANGIVPHGTALFGALGSRRKAAGMLPPEAVLWAEVAPFVCMAPETGREALAEYIVCLERPAEGRIGWLRDQINEALANPYDSQEAQDSREVAAMSLELITEALPWAAWIREETSQRLSEVVAKLKRDQ